MIDKKKKPVNMEYFNCVCSVITSGARCPREMKCRIAKAKAAFNKKHILFTNKLGLNIWKKQ